MQKTFSYTGIDRYKKRVKGEIKAVSLFEAKAEIRGKKISQAVVKELRELNSTRKSSKTKDKTSSWDIQITWGPFGGISSKELLIFTKKLATMTRSGLPIIESLTLAHSQIKNVSFKIIVGKILNEVNAGAPLSKALGHYESYFDTTFQNMVEAGEVTGKMDVFLTRIVDNLEKTETIKAGVKGALFYPVALIVISIGVIYFMLVNVVPIFVKMYSSVGTKLPLPTQILVDSSNWILNSGHLLELMVSFVSIYLIHKGFTKYSYFYRIALSTFALKTPLFGDLIMKSTVAKMALLMSNLFAAGIGVNEILRMSANSSTNLLFKEAQGRIAERVVSGSNLSGLFEEETIFPVELSQLIKVGESTGQMEEMLTSIARYYQEEFETVVTGLTKIIEPIMIVVVGGLIGMLIFALYMPIFNIGSAVK